MASGRILAFLAAILAAAPAAAVAPEQALLAELGWRIEDAPGRFSRVAGGRPCTRGSLGEAQAAGDLVLYLARAATPEQRAHALRIALDAEATLCAWTFRLGQATRRAAARLESNGGYRFSGLQLGWIGFGIGGARRQGWERFRSFGRGYRPAGANSAAIAAFYSGRVRSECGVGRQVAQLAGQAELYGAAAFDRAFDADELSIGTFVTLHGTDSILLGAHAGELVADGKAVRAARMGRQGFIGLPGIVVHVFGRQTLDDINNQAENFVVTDVDAAAARALRTHGGFRHYDRVNREIWRLSRTLPDPGWRGWERLLVQRDPELWAGLDPAARATATRMARLLDDPFYRGFRIYVHPMGVRPVGFHVARLLDRNPRTPYAIELTLHNVHTTLYRRWIAHRLRALAAGDPSAPRPLPIDAEPAAAPGRP
ncbi:hypothetical protein [Coralloluteibacterium stylophorae]|uniref:Uncharacterized protein n=1 Tax=Coralloluteibacterium stylophorae TaxID=1776034 RepID=A0A8J8AYU0_9GAMM|nr:hypothetical protein [Coralloluteibacterium stylophorae]MBS7456493.1 hypothetical protein [Coralloluteibacterium stylophorae]